MNKMSTTGAGNPGNDKNQLHDNYTPLADTGTISFNNSPEQYTTNIRERLEHLPVLTPEPQLTSGFGQFHTNEADPLKPEKILRPYYAIGLSDIRALIDNPPSVHKSRGQWFIPSTLPSRNFKEQQANGQFWMLWADMDKNPPPLDELVVVINDILGGADFELYNTRSATEENQKARLLIPLETPLSGSDFVVAQEILNDKLETLGIIPDRSNQGAAQLCYLPNNGTLYGSRSKRGGKHV
jgi:hypothetical protein